MIAKNYFPTEFIYRDKLGFSAPFGDFLLKNRIWGSFLNNIDFDLLETYVNTEHIREVFNIEDRFKRLTGINLKVLFYAINFQLWHETFFG